MPMAAFDTISVAKRLQGEFEMPQKQAEGVALVLHENFVGNVATKEDVKALKDDMKALKDDMKELATKDELRAEIAEVRVEIAQAANKTIYALGGLIGVLFVIDRLLPLFGTGG